MDVKKVYLLCDLCKECNFDGVVYDETGGSYPLLGEHLRIDNMEELFSLVREHHIVDFSYCYGSEKNHIDAPSEFKVLCTSSITPLYKCKLDPVAYYKHKKPMAPYIKDYIIFDKIFLKDYTIYSPGESRKCNVISLSDDGETIQATSLSNLTSRDKIILINKENCHYGEKKQNVIDNMALLFDCKLVHFHRNLYELVKPANTKSAIKNVYACE